MQDLDVYFSVKTANGVINVIAIYIVNASPRWAECASVIAKMDRLNPSIIRVCVYLQV